MPPYIDVVTIFASDVKQTAAFYTDLLDFQVVEPFTSPAGDFIWLRSEKRSASIAVQNMRGRKAKPVQADVPPKSGGLMLGFYVDDATALYKEWKDKGVELRTEPFDMGKGMSFGAKDPAGNYLQLFDVYPKFLEMQKKMGLD